MTSFLTAALIILSVAASPPESDPKDAAKDATPAATEGAPVWLRGNTHTHTLWSDGDAPPETAIAWYVDHDYDFLVLSDHNLVQTGERWFDVSDDGRLTPAKVDAVTARFGTDFAELREGDGGPQMRLRRLDELKSMFDRDGEFVLIPGRRSPPPSGSPRSTSTPSTSTRRSHRSRANRCRRPSRPISTRSPRGVPRTTARSSPT